MDNIIASYINYEHRVNIETNHSIMTQFDNKGNFPQVEENQSKHKGNDARPLEGELGKTEGC